MTKRVQFAPAGKYFVGDPCYGVPYDDWSKLLDDTGLLGLYPEDSKYLGNPDEYAAKEDQAAIFELDNGYYVLAAPTAYGDGSYEGSDGNYYPVDAGMIGAVSIEYALKSNTEERLRSLGSIVTFYTPIYISYDNGRITISENDGFGSIQIFTGDEDTCEYCGNPDCYDGECQEDEWDGQPDEMQEWHDFDPDC